MPKITQFIGQKQAVSELNDIISAKEAKEAKGEPFKFRPLLFKGLTGLGKTELSELMADKMNMHKVLLPPNSGWREAAKMASEVCSYDPDKDVYSAIPAVQIVDEAHTQKVTGDLLKVLFNDKGGTNTITRNGVTFFYDPYAHLPIFASNRTLDAALEGRCYKIHLVPYIKSEKIQLIELFAKQGGVTFDDESLEILENRVKPTAREVKDIVYPFTLFPGKWKGAATLQKALEKGFFPLGLRKLDIAVLKRIAELGAAPASVLRTIAQDDKKKDTQDKIDWIVALGLLTEARGGYTLSKGGIAYMEKLSEAQKKAKANKAKAK